MKKIYICNAYYHVFISVIKEINCHYKESDIILSDSIPTYKELKEILKEKNIFKNIYIVEEKKIVLPREPFFLGKLFYFKKTKKYIDRYLEIDLKKYNDVIIYNDWSILGFYLTASKIKYILYEDGLDLFKKENYTPFKYNWLDRFLGKLDLKILSVGESKYIKQIEVNDISGIKISKDIVKEVNRQKLMENLSLENKKKISNIFINEKLNICNRKKRVLILTEPLALDNRIANERLQIKIYEDIIKRFCEKDEVIYIKAHPRDTTNYNVLINEDNIINKNIPIEILNFNESIYFEKAITVTSTSLDGLKFINKKIKLGNEFIKEYM